LLYINDNGKTGLRFSLATSEMLHMHFRVVSKSTAFDKIILNGH